MLNHHKLLYYEAGECYAFGLFPFLSGHPTFQTTFSNLRIVDWIADSEYSNSDLLFW